MTFTGFPAAALDFYRRLEADNTKSFWLANKATFEEAVKTPMVELTEALADYGPFHLFRPYNDMRFSKNKPPYKTHQGAYVESEGGTGFYLHLSAEGLLAGSGYYSMAKDQLARFRAAVDAEQTGQEIVRIVESFPRKYEVGAMSELKTAPRGYPKDHPRIELIRRKGLMVSQNFGTPTWLHTKRVPEKLRACWDAGGEMNEWLDAHVGPSTLEPDGVF